MTASSHQLQQLNQALFYGILDTGYVSPQNWISKFDGLHQGGAKIIQIRAIGKSQNETRELIKRVLQRNDELPSHTRPIIIINDDLDLCLKYESVGLHIEQEDTPVAEARKALGPDRILGLSTTSTDQARRAMDRGPQALSYFSVGPSFASQTKPDVTPVGLKLAQWVADQAPELPFYCIGGINRKNAQSVRATGATRIVTVSDVLLAEDTKKAVQETIEAIA